MPRKKVEHYEVESKLLYQDWSVSRIARHFKITAGTVRDKLRESLREKQNELQELEGDIETIEEALGV